MIEARTVPAFAVARLWPRWVRALGLFTLVAAGLLVLPRGGPGAVVVSLIGIAVVGALAWIVADPADRPWVVGIALAAVIARDALVGAIDVALLTQGKQWYAPDESVYIGRAFAIWQHWLDPAAAFDFTDPYNRSWYVHAMARTYLLFGENVVIVKLLNTLLAVLAGVLGYRAMRSLGMPGARWALPLILAFPSFVFWTALALKDAWVGFFLIVSFWAASEFVRSRRYLWLPVALLALVPIESVRLYMLVTGALALLAVPFALRLWRDRLISGGALLAGVYILLAIVQPFADLGPNPIYIPIFLRAAAAKGARSSFVEPLPIVQGEPGDRFQIGVAGGSGVAPPDVTPRVVEVRPGTQIVIASATPVGGVTPAPTSVSGGTATPVVVRPGDIVVIAASPTPVAAVTPVATVAATGPPTPSPTLQLVVVDPGAKNTVGLASAIDPDKDSVQGSLTTNIQHLPLGVVFTLFAPFPWTAARTAEQLAAIPEMFVWYACLLLALVGFLVLLRRRDLRYAHGVAMIIGLVIVLSLIGANVGTLIRSRAMLIPYILLLSGVGIDAALRRYRVTPPWRRPS